MNAVKYQKQDKFYYILLRCWFIKLEDREGSYPSTLLLSEKGFLPLF